MAWTTYNGAVRYPSYDHKGVNKSTFKVTQMAGYNATNADGLKICFQLRGACPTLDTFCYGGVCDVALLNSQNSCCPITELGTGL